MTAVDGQVAIGPWRRFINIGLLVSALGLGQGAIFLAQTWLLALGEFELLSAFGTHYSFAMLSILLIDAGATTTLARQVACRTHEDQREIWQRFWETSAWRALLAALVGSAAAVYAWQVAPDAFSRSYVLFALPGALVWACNPAGLLDGLRMSGISGITGAFAYASSAGALVFARGAAPELAGAALGAAFSLGYGVTVAAQWMALRGVGWLPQSPKLTRAGLARALKDSLALLFQLLPGQTMVRVQLLLSAAYLGAETTAIYIYVKQVIIAATLFIGVLLRVDFPELVQKMSRLDRLTVVDVFGAQKATLACAALLTVGGFIVCGAALLAPSFTFSRVASTLVVFVPTILTTSSLLMMAQAAAAFGMYWAVATMIAVGVACGLGVSFLLIDMAKIYALLIGELASHAISFGLLYWCMRRSRDRGRAQPSAVA